MNSNFENKIEQLLNELNLNQQSQKDYKEKSKFEIDKKVLQQGTQVEKEHTDDVKVAESIARDHILEFSFVKNGKTTSNYYNMLYKMEQELRKEIEELKNNENKV